MKTMNMVLGCLLAATYLTAAPVASSINSGKGVAKDESRMVTLMHDPRPSTLRVPLPESFTRLQKGAKGAKVASVTVNFPAGGIG